MAISSTRMLNSFARVIKFSLTCSQQGQNLSSQNKSGLTWACISKSSLEDTDGSLEEQAAHRTGHPITLRQQLLSIVLGYNCLEDLIADGWQNPLIPVQPKAPVDLGQHSRVWL